MLTLNKKYKLKLFENKILRQIFRPKKEENGEWRKLYKYLYRSPNIKIINSKNLRWVDQVARMKDNRNALKNVLGKSAGERPLES